jgi:Mn-dependent DtxR family transcriptional regulator
VKRKVLRPLNIRITQIVKKFLSEVCADIQKKIPCLTGKGTGRKNINRQTFMLTSIHQKPKYSNQILAEKHLQTVYTLSRMGLNVMPLPYGSKKPFTGSKWGIATRSFNAWHLNADYAERVFFEGDNIAVMTGYTSNNLIVIDFDDTELAKVAYQYCKKHHESVYAICTRRGMHIYIHCTDSSIPSQKFNNIDVQSHGKYVVGAGSTFIDDNGKHHPYTEHIGNTAIPTLTPTEIQKFFYGMTQQKLERTTPSRSASGRYDRNTRDYLKNGHSLPEGTRNNRLFSACNVMLAYGDDAHAVYNTLYPIAIQSGLKPNDTERTLHSSINNFDPSKMRNGRRDSRDSNISLAEQFHATYTFKSPTTKAVLSACITMAKREYGKRSFRVASRELAELARVSAPTASKHLHILNDIGVLNLDYIGKRGTRYTKWNRSWLEAYNDNRIKNDKSFTVKRSLNYEVHYCKEIVILQEHKALGKRTTELYTGLLHKEPLTTHEIAELFCISYRSARYHVKKLLDKSLLEKDGKYYSATVNDIELETLRLRGKDAENKRNARHAQEQFHYRAMILIKSVCKHHEQKQEVEQSMDAMLEQWAIEHHAVIEPLEPHYSTQKRLFEMPQGNEKIIPIRQRTLFDTRPAYTP